MSKNQMEQKVIYENMRVQASEITARQAEKLLKIVPKQEIRLLKMQRKLVMTKLRMLYVYGMSQELLIKKKRMRYCGSESSI